MQTCMLSDLVSQCNLGAHLEIVLKALNLGGNLSGGGAAAG